MKQIVFLLIIVMYLAFATTSCRNPKNKDAAQTHEHGETTHVHDGTEHSHSHDSVPAGQVEFTVTDSLAAKDSAEKAHDHAHEQGHSHQH